jgi:unsaturated chondroitin disaccharide hydrolase
MRPKERGMQTPLAFRRQVLVAIACAAVAVAQAGAAEPAMADVIRDDFVFARAQYARLLDQLKGDPKLPRTFAAGRLVTVEPHDWTSGFFPGSLWLLYDESREARWRAAAEECTARLASVQNQTGTHDLGFMLFSSYGNGLRLTGQTGYRDVLLQGARTLSRRFNDKVGAIQSWDSQQWRYPVIVDNMMNLELLLWAAKQSPDSGFRELALRHADTTLREHFRPDGSSYHVVAYDPETGKVVSKQTAQGAADESVWARGQSWGLYGYTMMYRETRKTEYVQQAQKIARFLMTHPRLPEDKVPYWDYDAPGIPDAPRDSSAAAIMASALIELSGLAEADLARECLLVAERQLRSLSSPKYRAALGENGGLLLMHGVGHKPAGSEIDQPLIYGDYYFLEALLRYRARLSTDSVAK